MSSFRSDGRALLTDRDGVVARCLRRVVREVVQLTQAVGRHHLPARRQLFSLILKEAESQRK